MEEGSYHVMVGSDVTFLSRFVRIAPERAMEFIAKKMAGLLAR